MSSPLPSTSEIMQLAYCIFVLESTKSLVICVFRVQFLYINDDVIRPVDDRPCATVRVVVAAVHAGACRPVPATLACSYYVIHVTVHTRIYISSLISNCHANHCKVFMKSVPIISTLIIFYIDCQIRSKYEMMIGNKSS